MTNEKFGTDTALYNKTIYNSRGQAAEIRVGTYHPTDSTWWNRGAIINHYSDSCWGSCGGSNSSTQMTDNNGNLKKQEVYIPNSDVPNTQQITSYTTWWQQYNHDALNRLDWVREVSSSGTEIWKQDFAYDRYGNRTIDQTNTWGPAAGPAINKKNFTVDTTNNRLDVPAGQSGTMSYDTAGNLTTDTYSGSGVTRAYDAENRMTSETQSNGYVAGSYGYNADGQRVRRTVGGQPSAVTTWQVYGIGGELLAEYAANAPSTTPQKEYGYRNGQLLITADITTGPPAPSFSDDFNDNSLDTGKWSVVDPNSPAVVSETGQRLQITLPPNTAAYNGISSNATYDLTGKSVQVEVAQTVSQAGWCENFIQVVLDANNYYLIDVGAGSLVFRSMVGGVNNQTVIGYDASAFPYWRIRHDQTSNTINFETSSNGTAWITRKTVTPGFSLTALRFYLYAGAWGTGNGSPGAAKYDNFQLVGNTPATVVNLQWLVTDQVGTPRMIFDKTGSLAATKRHDYLPFGEELFATTGARSTAQGYSVADGVRQKFTQKERDSETGLDYFGARSYASTQGRFTSVDQGSPELLEPQTLNRYLYARNNPLYYIDADGNKDEPAKNQRVNQALAGDPTLLEVIKASNNFSQRAFEDALNRGELRGNLARGSGNNLRGAAGEAAVIDDLRRPTDSSGFPLGLMTVSQPANLSRFGIDLSLPQNVAPDIGAFYTNGDRATGTLRDVVSNAQGTTTNLSLSPNVRFGLYEVKAGFTDKNFLKGAAQVAATAALLKASGLPGIAVLAVDKAVFEKLSTSRREAIYNKVTQAGGYIQLYDGLAAEAAKRSRNVIRQAR